MAYRQIVDSTSASWDVWEVIPSRMHDREGPGVMAAAPNGRTFTLVVPVEMQSGWLAFQSATERRRVAPVPPGWEQWPDEQLLLVLLEAPVVGATHKPAK